MNWQRIEKTCSVIYVDSGKGIFTYLFFYYILLIMLLQLSWCFLLCLSPPSNPHSLRQPPHHCSCPWVIHINSLATLFPTLYSPSPWLFYNWLFVLLIFFKIVYLFFDRGSGREKERERNINVWLPLPHPIPGNLASNPGTCPDWELNLRPFDVQASTQSTEPHQLGCTS